MEWQPIESAPKDGRGILVIDATAFVPKAGMAWFYRDAWVGEDPGIHDREYCHHSVWPSPTHWMPLPELPKQERQDATD